VSLDELKPSGALALELRWTAAHPPDPETAKTVAALCGAHRGKTPVFLAWAAENGTSENGGKVRLRSRAFCVDPADDLLVALREILGTEAVDLIQNPMHRV